MRMLHTWKQCSGKKLAHGDRGNSREGRKQHRSVSTLAPPNIRRTILCWRLETIFLHSMEMIPASEICSMNSRGCSLNPSNRTWAARAVYKLTEENIIFAACGAKNKRALRFICLEKFHYYQEKWHFARALQIMQSIQLSVILLFQKHVRNIPNIFLVFKKNIGE